MNTDHAPTIVVGASRGLGHGIAQAVAEAGMPVIAVSRTTGEPIDGVIAESADATAAGVPAELLTRHQPRNLVIVAGASPAILPLQEQTWQSFSLNWETDVRIAFEWIGEALRAPLAPGGRVVVISSGAALQGSPLSGGYAGAKATQRFIAGYAQDESARADLGLTFTAVMPRITPATDLGRPAIEAYARRRGITVEEYLAPFGAPVTPAVAGAAVLELLTADGGTIAPGYLLTGDGLKPLP